jgi:hypothetical protein
LGEALGIDETFRLQAFSVVNSLQIIRGRGFHIDRGVSFEANLSLVLAQVNGIEEPTTWKAVNAFQPTRSYFFTTTASGTSETISGEIMDGTKVEFSPIRIATKYFPDQLSKVQARQLDLTALEFLYKMRVENLCTFCV